MTVAAVLAVADDNRVSPGVLGFVVVALLGVATWLLIRSMRRQLNKIDIPEEESSTARDESDVDTENGRTPPR